VFIRLKVQGESISQAA